MNTMHVSPAPGRMVPDPDLGDVLPDAGRTVPKNQYWMRRVADADVTVRTQTPKKSTTEVTNDR